MKTKTIRFRGKKGTLVIREDGQWAFTTASEFNADAIENWNEGPITPE